MVDIDWFKCKGGVWCDLFKLDLDHKYLNGMEGVFIIWTGGGKQRKVLIVGQGVINIELKKLRTDLSLQAFKHHGAFVTWAEVVPYRKNGVELFLAKKLKPAIPNFSTATLEAKCNLPWED